MVFVFLCERGRGSEQLMNHRILKWIGREVVGLWEEAMAFHVSCKRRGEGKRRWKKSRNQHGNGRRRREKTGETKMVGKT
jgi:hypothetical protein